GGPNAQEVAGGAALGTIINPTDAALTLDALAPLKDEAIARWQAAGISDDQLAVLQNATIVIANLAGAQVGWTSDNTIWIDQNAAGYGWFIDPTPADDSEFATSGGPAAGKVDLLTVLVHEYGHILGLSDNAGDGVMG